VVVTGQSCRQLLFHPAEDESPVVTNTFRKNIFPATVRVDTFRSSSATFHLDYAASYGVQFAAFTDKTNVSFSVATAEGAEGMVVFKCCDIFSSKRLQQKVAGAGQICNLHIRNGETQIQRMPWVIIKGKKKFECWVQIQLSVSLYCQSSSSLHEK